MRCLKSRCYPRYGCDNESKNEERSAGKAAPLLPEGRFGVSPEIDRSGGGVDGLSPQIGDSSLGRATGDGAGEAGDCGTDRNIYVLEMRRINVCRSEELSVNELKEKPFRIARNGILNLTRTVG